MGGQNGRSQGSWSLRSTDYARTGEEGDGRSRSQGYAEQLDVVISIVDSGCHAVMLQRLDGSHLAAIRIAEGKARTAVEFRRPTKALEDDMAAGGVGLKYFTVRGATLIEGGIPIVADGKIVGGIGVSGVHATEDAQIAQAGADAIVGRKGYARS